MPERGIEPRSSVFQTDALTALATPALFDYNKKNFQNQMLAEGRGLEPLRDGSHRFSKAAPCQFGQPSPKMDAP